MKTIIVIPTYYKQVKFFLRMRNSLKNLDYKLEFYVYKLSLYFLLKKENVKVHLIKKNYLINDKVSEELLCKCVEYKIGQINRKNARLIYLSTLGTLERWVNKNNTDAMFIWNGSSIDSIAATIFASKYKIKTLYFEVANIPGKIFVDKKGTNAQSELYANLNILNSFKLDEDKYDLWRKQYLDIKFKRHIVPQRKSIMNSIQSRYLIDIIGYIWLKNFYINKDFLLNKVKQIKNNIRYPLNFDKYDYKRKKYIFFPLQVSYDSQIVLNSDISLLEAFKEVLNYAKKNNLDLIVKPHPQECNYTSLKEFFYYRKDFILLNENTFLLMKYAQEVWTINSTVGLEGLIIGKKVKVLGKALYKNFKKDDLIRYINNYLINIDFFGKEECNEKEIKILLNRL
ncbi:hypothetical protein [Megamonas funiformis]|jgi:capsular polysaccharide export protein|uniref:capsular polysaccharide export protein, LipB/KpsS family n=1 Tax=Megamonas funiformis TaxID=437897 RepID=UPI003A8E7B22